MAAWGGRSTITARQNCPLVLLAVFDDKYREFASD
jgi:hypothetical protein